MNSSRITAALLAAAMASAPAGVAAEKKSFALATAPYTYHFPRDHAAHDAYQTEWWYYTGHLTASDGHPFGFELTFFRAALAPGKTERRPGQSKWRGNHIYPAHFAISDIRAGTFFFDERIAREGLNMGGADEAKLAVHSGDWTLRAAPGGAMVLHAKSGGHALDLTLNSRKPPAVHGRDGITKKGSCLSCASHYYSLTRMQASGSLAVAGTPLAVRGQAWMDHEYGSSQLQRNQIGWDWFSFQFDDRREVMYYRLRTDGGGSSPQSSGSLVDARGKVTPLMQNDVDCRVQTTFNSQKTKAVYPAIWHCSIPKAHLSFSVRPRIADQELAPDGPGAIAYWEGDMQLVDDGGKPIGTGYAELTGYAGAVRL